MARTKISMAISHSDLFSRPILAGTAVPRDIELDFPEYGGLEPMSIRMVGLEFDVCTMSLATFVKARGEGAPLVALPVFQTKRFLQPHIHIRKASPVRDLSDLKGKTVGLHLYWNSTAVWGRSIIWRMHGVAPKDITWITNRAERLKTQAFPPGVSVQRDPQGRDTPDLLLDGAVDAVIGLGPGGLPQEEGSRTGHEMTEDVRRPAYPDEVEAQRSYYRKTGVLPMTNVVVMREELAAEQPWIVESLYELFATAKQQYGVARAIEELLPGAHSPLYGGTVAEIHELFGEDPWAYTVTGNRAALDLFLAESADQGLTQQRLKVEGLFPGNLPDSAW